MNKCLEIPEVLDVIAEFTALPESGDDKQEEDLFEDAISTHFLSKSLLSFSLSCHYFNEGAMRIRWRRVPGLGPILKCFPNEVSNKHRMPTESEWNRVLLHTRHVKTLKCNSSDVDDLRFLNAHKSAAQLFPNLTHLSFNTGDKLDAFIECIPVLLSPSLQRIKVKSIQSPQFPLLVENIAQNVPLLPKLFIQCFGPPPRQEILGRHPPKLVFSFQKLTELYCPNVSINKPELLEIGKLPNLEVLAFRFPLIGDSSPGPLPTVDLFPALCVWNTLAKSIPDIILSCMEICKMPKLDNVSLQLTDQPDAIKLHQLFTQLGKHPSLTVVELTRPTPSVSDEDVESYNMHIPQEEALVTDAVLQPLYGCHELCFLSMRYCTSGLDDAALGNISNAWPKLTVLQIGTNCPTTYSRVTWDAFLQLAARCSALTFLGVNAEIKLEAFVASLCKPKPTPCPHVRQIAFNYADRPTPSNVAAMAAEISAAFPNAKVHPAENMAVLSQHDRMFWYMLQETLPFFQLTRVQEHLIIIW